jgi:hypothetical protein
MSTTRRALRLVLAPALAVLALAVPTAAQAAFGTHDLKLELSTTQAGGHPDVTTSFAFNTHVDPYGGPFNGPTPTPGPIPDDSVRNVRLSMPAGIVGDPLGVPQCTAATFGGMDNFMNTPCSDATQVGVAWLDLGLAANQPVATMPFPVYNVGPGADQAARFGFTILLLNTELAIGVRPGDGGLDTAISNINQAGRLYGQRLTLWGVPADPSHDEQRGSCLSTNSVDPSQHAKCPVNTPRAPFMRNATSCPAAAPEVSVAVESWQTPGRWVTEREPTQPVTGCGSVPFSPSLSIAPEATSADAPTGLDVEVRVAQNRDPDGLAAADVRHTVVTLPEGYAISPAAADGLQACDDDRVGLGSGAAPRCPDASRIGSATITSPILAKPLSGPIYLGPSSAPGRYRVYVVLEGSGIRLKLPGDIAADAQTGRLTTTFADTPQQPFSSFKLHFDGGPRAVLAAPASCGTGQATAAIEPWSGSPAVQLQAPVTLGGGDCPDTSRFAPSLSAGVADATAGADTSFALTVARDDRTQGLGAISSVTLPPGLTARVGTTPRCDAGRAAAGTCPAETRVGRVTVAAGAGPHPFTLTGTAYLTAGYRGAPFGLSLVVPALAGPYDLGTVVLRSAIRVAPDARVTVETDPLPQVLAGIPLRLRSVGLVLDRPGFMVTPTSCAPSAVEATVTGTAGATARLSSRFGMRGCAKLPFAPRMTATAVPSTRTAGAGLHVAIAMPAGQANMKSVAVSLPAQLAVKLKALGTVCTPQQLAALACPAAAKIGGASARTPLLDAPLAGAVYLVQSAGAALPKLVAVLQGGGLTIPLEGATSLAKGRVTTTFAAIPDVPITTFDLDLPRGRRAILQTKAWPCGGAAARVTFTAQNGAVRRRTVPVKSRCAGATAAKAAARR